jgi:hypothetical protein
MFEAATILKKKKLHFLRRNGPCDLKKAYLPALIGKNGLDKINTALKNLPCNRQSLGRT